MQRLYQPDRDGQVTNGRIRVEVCEAQAQDGLTTLRNLRRPNVSNDLQVGDIVNLLLRPKYLRNNSTFRTATLWLI